MKTKLLIVMLLILIAGVFKSPRRIVEGNVVVSVENRIYSPISEPQGLLEIKNIVVTGCENIEIILRAFDLSESEINMFLRIAEGESTCGKFLSNPASSAKGIYQILDSTWNDRNCSGNVMDSYDNVRCAIKVYEQYGFLAWEFYNLNIN